MKVHACPSPAELASFLEGKLSASDARRLRVHVAECESCQEVVSEAMVFLEGEAGGESEEPMEAEAQPHPFPVRRAVRPAVGEGSDSREESTGGGLATPGRWLPLAAAVVLALGLAAAWWLTSRPAGDLEALAGAQGEHRQTLVRLGGFPHAPPEPVQRSGSGGDEPAYALLAEAARLEAQAAEDPTAAHLHALGLAHLMLGRYDDAVATLERAGEATGDPVLERRIETDLAAALLEQGLETGQARTVARAHELLAELVEERPDPDLLFNAALALEELGARRSAIDTWDRYLEADPDTPWAEEARRRRARLVAMEGAEPEESAESIEDRVLLDLLGQPDGLTEERLAEATILADGYRKRFGDPWLSRTVMTLAEARPRERSELQQLHRRYAATRAAYRSEKVAICAATEAQDDDSGRRDGSSPAALALALTMGSCAYLANDLITASEKGTRVWQRAQAWKQPVLAGQGAWLAGLAAHADNRLMDALAGFEAAKKFFNQAGDRTRLASVDALVADLQRHLGDLDSAWQSGVATLRWLGLTAPRRHGALSAVAKLARDEGLAWTRHALLSEASSLGPAVDPSFRVDTWRQLGRLEGELSRTRAADLAFHRAGVVSEAINDPVTRRRARAFLDADHAAYLASRDPLAAAEKLRSAMPYEDTTGDLRYELALTRSRIHLAAGRVAAADRVLAGALRAMAAETDQLRHLADRAVLLEARSHLVRARVQLLIEEGRVSDALEVIHRGGRTAFGSPGLQPAAMRNPAAIGHDAVHLTFLSLDGELLVFRQVEGTVSLRREPVPRPHLRRLVDAVRTSLATGDDSVGGATAAAHLADVLLDPEDLERERLMVTPDDVMAPLPFDALPHPWLNGPIFLHHHILLAPVVSGGRTGDTRMLADESCVLLIEGAAMGSEARPDLARLEGLREELTAISQLYPCHRRARSAVEVREALASGVEVVHYAGHLIEGARGGLWLNGPDGPDVVSIEEIEDWSLAGAAVVLSACSGARGLARSSGLAAPAHAFLKAGAGVVVAAHWPVEDQAAADFAQRLHSGYVEGLSWAESLRSARLQAMREADSGPREWAGWVIVTS